MDDALIVFFWTLIAVDVALAVLLLIGYEFGLAAVAFALAALAIAVQTT